MAKSKDKIPVQKYFPQKSKMPKSVIQRTDSLNSWGFRVIDLDGPFGWRGLVKGKLEEVVQKLSQMEGMTYSELGSRKCHAISLKDMSKPARDRLEEIKQDDLDELYSIRLSGKERVFGKQEGGIIHIMWWDPEHRVCPSTKKGT